MHKSKQGHEWGATGCNRSHRARSPRRHAQEPRAAPGAMLWGMASRCAWSLLEEQGERGLLFELAACCQSANPQQSAMSPTKLSLSVSFSRIPARDPRSPESAFARNPKPLLRRGTSRNVVILFPLSFFSNSQMKSLKVPGRFEMHALAQAAQPQMSSVFKHVDTTMLYNLS